jgi:hypothetical protein
MTDSIARIDEPSNEACMLQYLSVSWVRRPSLLPPSCESLTCLHKNPRPWTSCLSRP